MKIPKHFEHNMISSAARNGKYSLTHIVNLQYRPTGGFTKRLIDIFASLSIILIFSPIILMIAALVKLSTTGSVFCGHTEIGYDGVSLARLKFRISSPRGGEDLAQYLTTQYLPTSETLWTRKHQRDASLPPLGAVLQHLGLDGLPQLFNVLRGDMSIVGPSPLTMGEIERYGSKTSYYIKSRPGLIGYRLVNGTDGQYCRRLQLDRDYTENWTVVTDCREIWRFLTAARY
ncbi:sugar transferase [Pararhizobium sp. YC-54]|uniref:sugar transferase n=1 Tax=Pararhizobium sp. YC-54 TaxID=2986920 RepID=UPI0021F7CC28|nr:sugar transferase [Pararhizobium sp. YC-54]MCV9997785.1 sugar transferase [Pararhizobium sp. YC-54]